jgi:hypothetical protein
MPESEEQERTRVFSDGAEAEKLLSHPMIGGFFQEEVDELFNAFCALPPGCSQEEYMRIHLEAFALLNLKAKLSSFVLEKQRLVMKDNYTKETEYNHDE